MSLWASLFAHLQQPVAQILLTRNDIADVSAITSVGSEGSLADKPAADAVPECTEHIHRALNHGSNTNCE